MAQFPCEEPEKSLAGFVQDKPGYCINVVVSPEALHKMDVLWQDM